jgi:hypothetical protein
MPTLLYLHGFNSSSQSKKALQTRRWINDHAPHVKFVCPDLPPFGSLAIKEVELILDTSLSQPVCLIGSSMGGFFATVLVEQYNLRGVLINPAVSPARGLKSWLGENENYSTGQKWILENHHIEEFRTLDPYEIKNKANYLVFLQTGDEVLNYRDAETRYTGANIVIEQGGDHSFLDYDRHLSDIYRFLFTDAKTT